MSELKPYPVYKDSDVEWIGEIPKDWNISKLKNMAYLRQINISTKRLSKDKWYYYDIPTIQQIGKGRVEEGQHIQSNKYLLEGNEILISKLNPRKGTVVQVEKNDHYSLICSTELMPVVPTNIHPEYLFYCLNNSITADVFNSMVTSVTNSHQRVNPKDIEDFSLTVPPYELQIRIARYLAYATNQIKMLIDDKERLIELLEEKRQAIITETVTKGLDSNVKMKDSGIEWIGEMPERWSVAKIKYYSDMKTGATPSRNNPKYWEEGTIKWMTSGEINQEYVYEVSNSITQLGYKNSSTVMLPKNTVMIALNGQGKTKGKVAILKVKSTCNQSLVGIISDEKNLYCWIV